MSANQVDIAADGDVILGVGGSDDDKKRLRVSSVILSAASPVFKALLGPHFREGQRIRSSTSPIEILLPDDDSEVMAHICKVIHYKLTDETQLEAGLLALATAVDKYNFYDALRVYFRGLLLHREVQGADESDVGAIWTAITTAYLVREPYSFKRFTRMLILDTTAPLAAALRGHRNWHSIPLTILIAVDAMRSEVRNTLTREAIKLAQCNPHASTDYTGFLADVASLVGSANWPPDFESANSSNLGKVIVKLEHMKARPLSCCERPVYSRVSTSDIRALIAKLSAMYDGLCLQCVIEDEPDLTKKCTKHA